MFDDLVKKNDDEEVTEIKTNDRFDKLTNLDISTHYRDKKFYVSKFYILGALSYWITVQSPYVVPDVFSAITDFYAYLNIKLGIGTLFPVYFTYDELSGLISEKTFESIHSIEILNHPKISSGEGYENRHNNPHPDYDFIDLGALARNVFYMILREIITQGSYE